MKSREEIKKQYWKFSPEKKRAYWEELIKRHPDDPHEFIRDFLVIDTVNFKTKTGLCAVVHIPGGRWCPLNAPYDVIVETVRNNPEDDDELISMIY